MEAGGLRVQVQPGQTREPQKQNTKKCKNKRAGGHGKTFAHHV
jgi:hypothetical protein